MIRDTPGHASPSALAHDLGISNAGMTGRLDALEKAGWIQRRADADDRRRVEHRGHPGRRRDLAPGDEPARPGRGRAVVHALDAEERATLAAAAEED